MTRPHFKGIFLSALLMSPVCSPAALASPQMEPLRAILEADQSVLPTVFARCIALNMLIGEWLAAQKDRRTYDMAPQYDKSAERFITYWNLLSFSNVDQSPEERFESLKTQVVIAKKTYYDKMLTAKTLTGHVFSDNLVESDTRFCNEMDKLTGQRMRNDN